VHVDITRGRIANHVFVTNADDVLNGERLPAVPAPGGDRQLRAGSPGPAGSPWPSTWTPTPALRRSSV
jgi:hypothetical protein